MLTCRTVAEFLLTAIWCEFQTLYSESRTYRFVDTKTMNRYEGALTISAIK